MKKLIYIMIFFLATLAMQAQFTKGISSATNVISQSAITLGSSTWQGVGTTSSNSFTTVTSNRFSWEGDSLNFQVELTGVSSGTIANTALSTSYDSITVDLWLEAYTQGSANAGFSQPSTTATYTSSTETTGAQYTLAQAYLLAWANTGSSWNNPNTYSVPTTWIPIGSVPITNHSAWFSLKSISRPGSMLGGKVWALVTNKRADCPPGATKSSGIYIAKLNVWAIQRWNVIINK